MRGFTFRLATLLRLREAARDERRSELAEVYRIDELLNRQSDGLAGEVDRLRAQCRTAAGPGTVDVDRLVEAQRYELALRAYEQQLAAQREAVAAEIGRRRQVLVEANREVRVLEKLRDRQARRYRADENRRETKQLDEVAVQRAAREDAP